MTYDGRESWAENRIHQLIGLNFLIALMAGAAGFADLTDWWSVDPLRAFCLFVYGEGLAFASVWAAIRAFRRVGALDQCDQVILLLPSIGLLGLIVALKA